jgi:hypothetical protein
MEKKTLCIAGILLLLGIFALALILGCNGNPTEPNVVPTYSIRGALVVDPNLDSNQIMIGLTRDDSVLTGAAVFFNGHQIPFSATSALIDSVYYFQEDSVFAYVDKHIDLRFTDPSRYADTFHVAVADTFSILTVDPFNHLLLGIHNCTINWSGANLAETYVMAAVKANHAYQGEGYSAYPISNITGGTIPPSAFAYPISDQPDTGLYNIYVYAITGSPDSAFTEYMLPVPLPDQLGKNITGKDIEGSFGTVTVVYYDTVRVAIMQ